MNQVPLNPQYDKIITTHKKLDQQIQASFTRFLQQWRDKDNNKKYLKQAEHLLNHSKHIMVINANDFHLFDQILATTVMNQYSRYQTVLNKALTTFMYQVQKSYEMNTYQSSQKDKQNLEEIELYQVAFDRAILMDDLGESVRSLKCQMLGRLRSIVGTVTRVSQIRPQLLQGVFQCGFCRRLSEKIPQQYKYTTPKKCLAQGCSNNCVWELNNKHSTFADFQKVRVQEDSSKIPPGSMPRSIDVILRNQNIQKGQPGDQIHIVGYLAVIPDIQSLLKPGQRTSMFTKNSMTRRQIEQQGVNGIKGIKQLSYKLCFMGVNVFVMNNQFNEQILTQQQAQQAQAAFQQEYNDQQIMTKLLSKLNESEILQIKRIKQNHKKYQQLAESLFHEIFGHLQIKKALLLQLLGGIHKKTGTKISLRGDINVLIVGDPSTAKSQFLKCINKFVPRSVYTNGKTTTAAGLTASVVRDQESGNVSIQAGALLLADNGICCIDEFDKMELKDQVAIHEAMQQQTISIAKAGIQATLHARTSILAAANPIFGRYDKSQSLRKNINISPPIMSRFDLFFIICDEVNYNSDTNLSKFIVSMHQTKKQVKLQKPYTMKQVKSYLSIAKKVKPRLTHQAAQQLRRYYVQLRQNDKKQQNSQYQVTVRQLESMIRLSQALAKLNLDLEVKPEYVREAHHLLSHAIVKLQKSQIQLEGETAPSQYETAPLGLRGIQSIRDTRTDQKKLSIPHDVYTQIKADILRLFEQKEQRHRKNKIEDVELYLTEQDVIAYLTTINYENGDLASQNENKKVSKLYHGIINHLLKQKILVVLEEPQQYQDSKLRKIGVHPNVQLMDDKLQMKQDNQILKSE